jgi:hypothetical protein
MVLSYAGANVPNMFQIERRARERRGVGANRKVLCDWQSPILLRSLCSLSVCQRSELSLSDQRNGGAGVGADAFAWTVSVRCHHHCHWHRASDEKLTSLPWKIALE